jgi:NADPH-dependent 2,4-dienoyl-CoA reductase/sulfur reductase-like enzyme/nitrite reductase/ring-hydroxylating ferredoxin subunit
VSGDVELTGPDFARGVPLSDISDGGMLRGQAFGKPVLVARRGDEVFAVDAMCTHYGASLSDGVMVGDTVRCPWHHACFSLRTGAALRAPALRPLARWNVQRAGDRVVVTGESTAIEVTLHGGVDPRLLDSEIVILGGGAAGDAAADMLRREGHAGPITIVSADDAPPSDRPNLSKDYLAGNAPEEWIPLRTPEFYRGREIELVLGRRAVKIERAARQVILDDGSALRYRRLLIATGSAPVELPAAVSGGRVLYLRSLADSRRIIAAAEKSRRAAVVGASFIGLEVAASLRARGLEVHVVAPEEHPLERVMGRAISGSIRRKHEQNGVIFHLGRTLGRADDRAAVLDDGHRIDADLVVAGVGVRPNVQLAESAGLDMDRGISVDEHLQTSDPAIFAAGDVARYPDPRSDASARIRVEHWVVAQRQGQTAALNMLGARRRFDDVPFFWSAHYDATIAYVGHAEQWDEVQVDGNVEAMDAEVRFLSRGRTLAVATISRDRASLEAELAMERGTMTTTRRG